jgi:hypothetical protein
MNLKLALSTATALGLLMGAAWAGDDNKNYLDQNSGTNTTGNSALITQSGDNNQAGSSSLHMKQTGIGNELTLWQRGNDNTAGLVAHGLQQNLSNGIINRGRAQATINQYTSGNTIGRIYQTNVAPSDDGNVSNILTINQGAFADGAGQASNNLITSIEQSYSAGGPSNTMAINQSGGAGDANLVGDSVTISALGFVKQYGGNNAIDVDQDGQGNSIWAITQGRDSAGGVFHINVFGGKNNSITTTQTGANNAIGTIEQIDPVYDAWSNTATVIQNGNGNYLKTLSQNNTGGSAFNTASLQFYGGNNGTTGFGTLAPSNQASLVANVVQAEVRQTGAGNMLGYLVSPGDNNSFGFTQDGQGNWINGVNSGNDHQVAIWQHGDGNVTDFAQSGTGNNLGVSIDGSYNQLNIDQSQSGASGNKMSVTITGDKNNNYPLTGNALTGAADAARDLSAPSLVQGDLFQNGSNNSLTMTVTASNQNAFATYQSGSNNTIVHSISDGDSNQAVIAQNGLNNMSNTTQVGAGNNLGVSQ